MFKISDIYSIESNKQKLQIPSQMTSEKISIDLPEDREGQMTVTYPPTKTETCPKPPPIVVLLGYAGCSDETLSTFTKVYEDQGCITLRSDLIGKG